jgi:hypothetical protein
MCNESLATRLVINAIKKQLVEVLGELGHVSPIISYWQARKWHICVRDVYAVKRIKSEELVRGLLS